MKELVSTVLLLLVILPSSAFGQQSLAEGIQELAKSVVSRLSPEQRRLRVAVVPFEELRGTSGQGPSSLQGVLGAFLAESLTTELFDAWGLRVVERTRLHQILTELKFSATGAVDRSTAAQIGELLGAGAIVIGTFTDFRSSVVVNSRMIDVATGEVFGVAAVRIANRDKDLCEAMGRDRCVDVSPPVGTKEPATRATGESGAGSGATWGMTASASLGPFDSAPIHQAVSPLIGSEVYVRGRLLDVGVAYSRGGRFVWRLAFAFKPFEDGSFTRCQCASRQIEWVSDGVNILGFRIEPVVRLAPSRWRVQPMVTGHAGVGYVRGNVVRYEGPIGSSPTSNSMVGADQLFGSSWFPVAGAGLGVVGDLGRDKRLTWSATVVGVEFPGVYVGGLQLTYWFR